MINPMIRNSASINGLQEGVYVAKKSRAHQSVSLRLSFLNKCCQKGRKGTTTGYTPTVAGTWHWVAVYSGDTNNNSVGSGVTDEAVKRLPPDQRLQVPG